MDGSEPGLGKAVPARAERSLILFLKVFITAYGVYHVRGPPFAGRSTLPGTGEGIEGEKAWQLFLSFEAKGGVRSPRRTGGGDSTQRGEREHWLKRRKEERAGAMA